jgi:CHAD domain-containing protein
MKDSINRFPLACAARLRKKLRRSMRRAIKHPDEETIHVLRVSIRRLSYCLREFRQFFLPRKTKKILKRLDKMMELAGEIRNRDVAIRLIGSQDPDLAANLRREREWAKRKLTRALIRWRRHD